MFGCSGERHQPPSYFQQLSRGEISTSARVKTISRGYSRVLPEAVRSVPLDKDGRGEEQAPARAWHYHLFRISVLYPAILLLQVETAILQLAWQMCIGSRDE